MEAQKDRDEYDVVIVGGGTAGLVLASRLTEDPALRVVVLEAGDDMTGDPRVDIPGLWPVLQGSTADWNFRTVAQPGLNGREFVIPQGRALGGSSAINTFMFTPTSKRSVDGWSRLDNHGWHWDTFNSFLWKSCTLTTLSGETTGDGPVQLAFSEDLAPQQNGSPASWANIWVQTLANLGFPECDAFCENVSGALRNPESIHPQSKTRSSAATAYLDPVRSRPNLTVLPRCTVTRVLLSRVAGGGALATGVEYLEDGRIRNIRARREVIVASGAFGSPRILELSGIGRPDLLASLDIDVVVDNPFVGENLQNHPYTGASFKVREGTAPETLDALVRQEPTAVGAAMAAYGSHRGPMTSSGYITSAQLPLPEEDRRAIDHVFSELNNTRAISGAAHQLGAEGEAFDAAHTAFVRETLNDPTQASGAYITASAYVPFEVPDPSNRPSGSFFTVAVLLTHPLSRGSVHITSKSLQPAGTASGLSIDPGYMSHPIDIEVLARHLRFMERDIVATAPLSSFLDIPEGQRQFEDLEKAKDYIRRTSGTYFHHYTSTCAMGRRDMGGVVNDHLVVHGCKNLRVCDASIIPFIPRANPQAVVYGLAELGAQIIKQDLA